MSCGDDGTIEVGIQIIQDFLFILNKYRRNKHFSYFMRILLGSRITASIERSCVLLVDRKNRK